MTATVESERDGARRTLVAHAVLGPFILGAWLCSIAYEIVIGRHLGPGAYGLFETVVGLLAVPGVVASGAQLLLARAAAGRAPLERAWRTALLTAAAVTAAIAAVAAPLAAVLHLPAGTLLYSAALAGLWTLLGAARGAAQGRERYLALGGSFLAENLGRLIGTYGLIGMGYWGPLWALGAGGVVAFAPLARAAGRPAGALEDAGARGAGADLALYVAGAGLVAALPVLPLLAMRGVLGSTAYAALAAMALLGRGLAQVGGWLTQALYPRLLAAAGGGGATLAVTVRLALVLSVAAAVLAALVMPRLLSLAFAGRYVAYLPLFRVFLFAVLPVALIPLWVTQALAERSRRGLALLALGVPLEAVGLVLFVRAGLVAPLVAQALVAAAITLYAADRRRRATPLAPLPGA